MIGEALIDIVETDADTTEHVGGSPANVALGLGRLGVRVALATQVGDDSRGRQIRAHLASSGVEVMTPAGVGLPTSTARARIGPDGQAAYDFDISWTALPALDAVTPRIVHTGSLAAFVEPGASATRIYLAGSEAAERTFDPNIRPALSGDRSGALAAFEAMARRCTVVKMSDEDAAWLYPDLDPDAVLATVLALGPRLVALTRGAEGAVLVTPEQRVAVPGHRVVAVDTIGAGDTFMASLLRSVLRHGSAHLSRDALERIGDEAVRAAALTVSRQGADLPWAEELA